LTASEPQLGLIQPFAMKGTFIHLKPHKLKEAILDKRTQFVQFKCENN